MVGFSIVDEKKLKQLQANGQLPAAEDALRKICDANPTEIYPHQVLAVVQKMLGKFDDALKTQSHCIKLDPDNAVSWNNNGCVLHSMSSDQEALASFQKAIELDPNYVDALASIASTQIRLEQFDEAEKNVTKALSIDPSHFVALQNQAAIEHARKNLIRALELAESLKNRVPESAEIRVILGKIYLDLGEDEKAKAEYEQGLSLRPELNDGMIAMAALHAKRGGPEAAITYYEACLKEYPNSELAEIRWNLGLLYLKTGNYKKGWDLYEWRWKRRGKKEAKQSLPTPEWFGTTDISGKTLLIYHEQGYGDQIQFVRYAGLIQERANCRVIVWVDENIAPLFRNLPKILGIVPVTNGREGQNVPEHDVNIPFCSLPLAYGNLSGMFAPPPFQPYLKLSVSTQAEWKNRLNSEKLNIGFAYCGNKAHGRDKHRSIPIETFQELFEMDAQFHCLQKFFPDEDREILRSHTNVSVWSDAIKTFEDAAYLTDSMDIVIAVDTSVAHLSGALNKSTYLLIDSECDFRWLYEGATTAWYPAVLIVRQQTDEDWSNTLENFTRLLALGLHEYRN